MREDDFILERDWSYINTCKTEITLIEPKWKYRWSINSNKASLLYNAILLHKPSVIVETGTFEAIGTHVMAKACFDSKIETTIYTFDYDDDPLTFLDRYEWEQLRNIREKNLNKLRNEFTNVRIKYIDGDTRETLKNFISTTNLKWDFFFQDSMHFYDGILSEWNFLKPFSNPGAVAVFDDISLSSIEFEQNGIEFCKEFTSRDGLTDWNYISKSDPFHQFWVQKK